MPDTILPNRVCRKCQTAKPLSEFYKISPRATSGHKGTCRKCVIKSSVVRQKIHRRRVDQWERYVRFGVAIREKACTKCKAVKPAIEFKLCTRNRTRLRTACKECDQRQSAVYKARSGASESMRAFRERYKTSEAYGLSQKMYAESEHGKKTRLNYRLLSRFGITVDDYDFLLSLQGGGCGICGRKPVTRRLHVDHNHETGKVRGLLCLDCNTSVGRFKEDPSLFDKAKAYVINDGLVLIGRGKKLSKHERALKNGSTVHASVVPLQLDLVAV